jgi:hypothetical protein
MRAGPLLTGAAATGSNGHFTVGPRRPGLLDSHCGQDRHGARSRHRPQTRKEKAIFSARLLAIGGRVGQAEAMVFQVECPFCGEPGGVEIEAADFEPGEYVLVQDCEVCCRPWTVRVQRDPNGAITVSAERD